MNLLILRNSTLSDANGTFGNLLIDGEPFCATCEQPWNNNLQNHSCIPEGDYELRPYDSPAHAVVFHNPELGIFASQISSRPASAGGHFVRFTMRTGPSRYAVASL